MRFPSSGKLLIKLTFGLAIGLMSLVRFSNGIMPAEASADDCIYSTMCVSPTGYYDFCDKYGDASSPLCSSSDGKRCGSYECS